jgi:hypothetical protein
MPAFGAPLAWQLLADSSRSVASLKSTKSERTVWARLSVHCHARRAGALAVATAGITAHPDAACMLQIAKNLTDKPPRVPRAYESRGVYIKR